MKFDPLRSKFPPVALAAVFFLVSCGNRATPAPKPPPPPPFEFLGSWGDKGVDAGKLDAPVAFSADSLGRVFFVDPGAGFVDKFESDGTPLLSFEDTRVRRAAGIAVDAGGAIYVADAQLGSVLVFFPDGTFFQSWRTAAQKKFSGALGISLDEEGTLFVPDPAKSRVLKFNNRGRLLKSWPAPEKPASPDERPSWVSAEPDDAESSWRISTRGASRNFLRTALRSHPGRRRVPHPENPAPSADLPSEGILFLRWLPRPRKFAFGRRMDSANSTPTSEPTSAKLPRLNSR